MLQVFSDFDHFNFQGVTRGDQFPLLKPFTGNSKKNKERKVNLLQWIRLVRQPEDADIAVLPLSWNSYVREKKWNELLGFIDKCRAAELEVISVNLGDHGVRVPKQFSDIYVFRQSGYRSALREREIAMPVFIDDPWKALYGDKPFEALPWEVKPRVGFCGHSVADPLKVSRELLGTIGSKVMYGSHLRPQQPESVGSPTYLRHLLLNLLEKSAYVTTDFIRRENFGTINQSRRKEFLSNISRNPYTLCVRGTGNFSVRFYETIAMGRIPLLYDTNCPLPKMLYELSGKYFPVAITKNKLVRNVLLFNNESRECFTKIQRELRSIWLTYCNPISFIKENIKSILFGVSGSVNPSL